MLYVYTLQENRIENRVFFKVFELLATLSQNCRYYLIESSFVLLSISQICGLQVEKNFQLTQLKVRVEQNLEG